MLIDEGFIELPARGGGVRYLNQYRFVAPYWWHVWVGYLALPEGQAMQMRLAGALRIEYELVQDRISETLAALYDATGQAELANM